MVGGILDIISFCICCCVRCLVRSMLMFVVCVCVRVGLSLSASLCAMFSWSFAAVLVFTGFVDWWSSCIQLCRVDSISFSSLLMSSWASLPRIRFHRVVLDIPSSSAICWFVWLGKVVMRFIACLVRAVFFASVVDMMSCVGGSCGFGVGLGGVCFMVVDGFRGLYLLTILNVDSVLRQPV